MRKATRRFRAAKGRFGPRRRFKGARFKRRFGKKGKRKGFFVGNTFVDLDRVPDDDMEAWFKGKSRRKKGGKITRVSNLVGMDSKD